MIDLETAYPTRVPLQVRFSDTDASGHINNVSYIAYLELGRTRYFSDVHGALNTFGLGWILGEVQCRYLAQGYFGDNLEIRCGTNGIGRASFRTGYEIANTETGVVLARGMSITVCYDFKAKKAIRISDEWRRKVAVFEGWDESLLL